MMVSEGIHLIASGVTNMFVVSDSGEAALIDAYWPSEDIGLLDALSKVVDPGELRTVFSAGVVMIKEEGPWWLAGWWYSR